MLLGATPVVASATAAGGVNPQERGAGPAPNHLQQNPQQPQQADKYRSGGALGCADVPHRAARLLRVRFSGLPLSLLRDCTASVWWRPPGHYDAYAVCHVQTGTVGGVPGCFGGAMAEAPSGGAVVSVRSTEGAAGSQRDEGELLLDLTGLPPLPPPPPPLPLPYIDLPSPMPPPPTASPSATPASGSASPAGPGTSGAESSEPASGGLVLTGDIKVQLFRGYLADPPADVFKGRVTQLSAWINTGFLDPGIGVLELGRREMDKLAKPLRRWRGAVGVVVEYQAVAVG
ncbi:hypothetical protein TSOC_002831 [Tetrabaena socialis]|uniref:Uncharacterized protein n=1 Tax=Tetrabaena socialis TaxID=47790 RepID=A0A2J8AD47_9CHLO|nr:hypothetical protein TSOC_002831 [Tetrabaena socialis]|eukprot:PNH10438.1 hypothetical protein TSOC_002831 [Tetrabaena socialis]